MKIKHLIFVVIILSFNLSLSAQWIQTNGPEGGSIFSYSVKPNVVFAVLDSNIFAGTHSGLYVSDNNGLDWKRIKANLPYGIVLDLVVEDNRILVCYKDSGIFKSEDGLIWQKLTIPLSDGLLSGMKIKGNMLFAYCNDYKIFKSSDGGINWMKVYEPIAKSVQYPNYYGGVIIMEINGNNIYAGCHSDFIASNDTGKTWKSMYSKRPICPEFCKCSFHSIIKKIDFLDTLICLNDGQRFSQNCGKTWDILTPPPSIENEYSNYLFYKNNLMVKF